MKTNPTWPPRQPPKSPAIAGSRWPCVVSAVAKKAIHSELASRSPHSAGCRSGANSPAGQGISPRARNLGQIRRKVNLEKRTQIKIDVKTYGYNRYEQFSVFENCKTNPISPVLYRDDPACWHCLPSAVCRSEADSPPSREKSPSAQNPGGSHPKIKNYETNPIWNLCKGFPILKL